MNDVNDAAQFPCVRNCCLNEDDICLGCFRSMQEIMLWNESDQGTRGIFLQQAQQRRESHRLSHVV